MGDKIAKATLKPTVKQIKEEVATQLADRVQQYLFSPIIDPDTGVEITLADRIVAVMLDGLLQKCTPKDFLALMQIKSGIMEQGTKSVQDAVSGDIKEAMFANLNNNDDGGKDDEL